MFNGATSFNADLCGWKTKNTNVGVATWFCTTCFSNCKPSTAPSTVPSTSTAPSTEPRTPFTSKAELKNEVIKYCPDGANYDQSTYG